MSDINKVVYGEDTLIDLTNDTVTSDSLLSGVTAHDKSGATITGAMVVNTDYTELENKPSINGVELEGNVGIKSINNQSLMGSGDITFVENTIVVGESEPTGNNVSVWIDTSAEGVLNHELRKKGWTTNAHRGNITGHSTTLKENTLGAYHNAYLMGADVLECDARKSADGVFMCNHDTTVTDINGTTYNIADCSCAFLQNLVLSTDAYYGNQGVPKLEDVIKLAYNYGLNLDVDLKMHDSGLNDSQKTTFSSDVAKLVAKCGLKGKVTYAISNSGTIAIPAIIAIDPEATFTTTKARFDAISNLSTILPDYKSRCIAYTSDYSQSTIDAIRDAGYLLECSEVDSSNFEQVISLNPDAIEYVHSANFRDIEDLYFANLQLF